MSGVTLEGAVPSGAGAALGGEMGRRRVAALNLAFSYANLSLTLVSGVVLVPAYLRSFSLATYGAWLASGNILGMVGVLDAGLNLVFSQRLAVHAARSDRSGFARVAGVGLLLVALSASLVVLVGTAVAQRVPGWVRCPEPDQLALSRALIWAAVGTGGALAAQGLGAILQAWEEPVAGGSANVAASGLALMATIAALWTGHGVLSLGIGIGVRGVAGLAMSALAVARGWRRLRLPPPCFTQGEALMLVRKSGPMFASRIGSAVLGNSEALILAVLIAPETAGIVALTGRIHSFAALLLAPIGSSAYAGIARLAATGEPRRVRGVVGELFGLVSAAAGLLVGGAIAVNPGFVQLWVGSGAFGGLALSAAIGIATVATTRMSLAGLILAALGRPAGAAWTALAEAGIRIPLMVLLVKSIGPIGLPLATIVTALLLSGSLYAFQFRRALEPGGGEVLSAGTLPLILALVVGILMPRALEPVSWIEWIAHGAVAALALLLLLLATSRDARIKCRNLAARWRARPGAGSLK